MNGKRYLIRAAKYFVLLVVLLVALYALRFATGHEAISAREYIDLYIAPRLTELGLVCLLFALVFPRFGFVSRAVAGRLPDDRGRILAAFAAYGFHPVETTADGMIFRAEGVVRRLRYLYEDRLLLRTRPDGGLQLQGIRGAAVRIAYRLQTLERTSDETNP